VSSKLQSSHLQGLEVVCLKNEQGSNSVPCDHLIRFGLAPSLSSIAFALAESLYVRVVYQIIWSQIQGTVCQ
jgi:hypothetical protein